jgi:hypothetical protein
VSVRVFEVPIMSAEMDGLAMLRRGSLVLLTSCAAPRAATRGTSTGDALEAGSIGSSRRRRIGTQCTQSEFMLIHTTRKQPEP